MGGRLRLVLSAFASAALAGGVVLPVLSPACQVHASCEPSSNSLTDPCDKDRTCEARSSTCVDRRACAANADCADGFACERSCPTADAASCTGGYCLRACGMTHLHPLHYLDDEDCAYGYGCVGHVCIVREGGAPSDAAVTDAR